ncbi:Mov34/MPN/PAD-1 family protein [Erythrobacter sp. W53]|uniref:Mov34/MPN/PAD-1 family protein n=1 Tax=Erythrobacter sp. W53 TaxID=3425947 RepID=UPI003D7693E2
MTIEVTSAVIERLLTEAAQAHPRECCGILLGEGAAITILQPAKNVHPKPETHFEIDPQALVDAHRAARDGGPAIMGYYHSHPNGLAHPSSTDMEMSVSDGSIWAIVATRDVTFWRSVEQGFVPLPYSVSAR